MLRAHSHVLFKFVGIAAALAEVGKAVLSQCVMAGPKPPAHTRSSCRKGRNSTAEHGWARMASWLEFEATPAIHLIQVWHRKVVQLQLPHSFAAEAVMSGKSLPTMGKILGHSQPQTTARCAHLADDSLRDASDRVASSSHEPTMDKFHGGGLTKPVNCGILKETDDAASDSLPWAPTKPLPDDAPAASPQLSPGTV